jgi:hypothetical protein
MVSHVVGHASTPHHMPRNETTAPCPEDGAAGVQKQILQYGELQYVHWQLASPQLPPLQEPPHGPAAFALTSTPLSRTVS